MATSAEFPGSCSTNIIILPDFGEVAYIVCTLATPPTANANNALSSGSPTGWLKQTEDQFRKASILAALDEETLQLYTFYKKVDVMKDQRTLLSKFGTILRSNSCTIAYKAAVRAPDLFKPDNSRLHGLFITAILASIEFQPQDNRQVLPLGQRYYAVENKPSPADELSSNATSWNLVRVDLQIVAHGYVLLTLVADTSRILVTVRDVHWQWKAIQKSQQSRIPVILAPFGRLSTYGGGWIGSWNEVSSRSSEISIETREKFNKWREIFAEWAKSETDPSFDDDDDNPWVELQIARILDKDDSELDVTQDTVDSNKAFDFQQVFWPAHLCFILRSSVSAMLVDRLGFEDPIKYIQDWVETAQDRFAKETEEIEKENGGESPTLFGDDGSFDTRETFQPFGPPAFPASQTIYPTPPDAIMTHATPGMSSVDGTAMTPATGPRTTAEIQRPTSRDMDMTDVEPSNMAAVGSGYYDEDLFDEMPDDDFGQADAADEPNWDFFDKQDMDMDGVRLKVSGGSKSEIPALEGAAEQSPGAQLPTLGHSDEATAIVSPVQSSNPAVVLQQDSPQSKQQGPSGVADPGPSREVISANEPLGSSNTAMNETMHKENEISAQRQSRRRSSIYEVPSSQTLSPANDNRYQTHGTFWFDYAQVPRAQIPPAYLSGWSRRTPSSNSTSDDSASMDLSPQTGNELDLNRNRRWTVYEPASPEAGVGTSLVGVDMETIDNNAKDLFERLKTRSAALSLETNLLSSKRPNLGIPKDKPGLLLLFSQIFIDQYAQASLTTILQPDRTMEPQNKTPPNLLPDLENLSPNSTYATLNQLSDPAAVSANSRPMTGKLVKIPERQIRFRRGDKEMMASKNIVPFWDTLELQPYSSVKDATAFCIHPPGSGITDGCVSFLNRITEAYNNCNLGTHKIGKLSNLTDTGLVTWSVEREKTSPLMAVAIRLGEILATTDEIKGTVLLYIVGVAADPTSYLQCCVGFYACYQAYRRHMSGKSESLELVLQVVPAGFIASTEAIVVPSQADFNSLALEVYRRLPPADTGRPQWLGDSPLLLAEETDWVRFKLETKPTTPFLKDGVCLHLAYSHSDDQRWVVACWTDGTGEISMTMSYLLRVQGHDRGRPVKEIVQDMWEVSHDVMKTQRCRWRLVVSRIGLFDTAEENAWNSLANAAATDVHALCTLQMLSIELNPSLQISTLNLQGKTGQMLQTSHPNMYGTPVSTPQAMTTTSPEQVIPATPTPGGTTVVNAPTPPELGFDANIDGDLSLSDPTDESWAFILPFGVNQNHDILDNRQVVDRMLSGYLLKRVGPREDDGLSVLGVHYLQPSTTPRARGVQSDPNDEVLEDIIQQFRGLVTLAAIRGCMDKSKPYLPWHIYAALTGSRGLNGLI